MTMIITTTNAPPYNDQLQTTSGAGRGSSVGCASAWYADGRGFDHHVRQYSFVEIGHEKVSMAILYISQIQEGQLSVPGERMCTKY